jgi:hypothetical protein
MLLLDVLPAVRADKGLAATAQLAAAAAAAAAAKIAAGAEAAACKCMQLVLWITKILPPCAVSSTLAEPDVLQRLMHIPHVPLEQAHQLVAAGVHVSYAQLLAAANSMVAGVEVWVEALQLVEHTKKFGKNSLCVPPITVTAGSVRDSCSLPGVPAEAIAICCGCAHIWDWVSLLCAAVCVNIGQCT